MRRRLPRALGPTAAIVLAGVAGVAAAPPALGATARHMDAAGQASRAHRALQPWPVTITVRTVPPLPGVRFVFDDVPLVTGPRGSTSFTERHNFSAHTLRLADTQINASGRRYTFVRWAGQRDPDQVFRPMVQGLPMRADYTVTASFAVMCQVSPRLVRQDGSALGAARVSRITLRSSLGQPATLSPARPTWLACAWPVFRDSLLSSRDLRYSVQSMLVSGSNVVRAGVQRFNPSQTQKPTVTGYFYSLTITAHDAIFGGATGSYALLTMPDHTVRRVVLGREHTATVTDLPLGDYRVEVKAHGASISAQTLRLSKDQTANLAAVSRADIAVVCGALAFGLVGVPLLSRTRRRRILAFARHPRRKAGEEAS